MGKARRLQRLKVAIHPQLVSFKKPLLLDLLCCLVGLARQKLNQ